MYPELPDGVPRVGLAVVLRGIEVNSEVVNVIVEFVRGHNRDK